MENQNINQTQTINKKEHDFRNIMITIVGVFVILAAVSGATFAYYAFTATNNTTINATAATASLSLSVTKVSPTTSGALVPQLEAGLKSAATSSCIDGNNNVVCHVYSITVTNSSTAAATVGGSLSFSYPSGSSYTNLKWKVISANPTNNSSATYGTAINASTTATANSIGTVNLAVNASKTFYVVIWINETNTAQNSTDYGRFTGIVNFTDSTGKGLTSTFTA